MQTMSADQSTNYMNSAGPHQPVQAYYIHQAQDPQYAMRNSNSYPQPMQMPQYFQIPMSNGYMPQPQMYYPSPYLAPSPFVQTSGPRPMNNSAIRIVRPPNETSNGVTGAMQPKATSNFPHGTNSSPQSVNPYAPPFEAYPAGGHYGPKASVPHNSNSSQVSQGQVVYSMANHQQQASPSQIQASSYEQQHASASLQPQQIPEKRKRTPLSIVNPESREVLELPKPIAPEIPTPTSDDQVQNDPPGSSTVKTTKPVDVVDKTQKQADFRKDFARLLADAPPSTDKSTNQLPTSTAPVGEPLIDDASTKQKPSEQITSSASSSRSSSISRAKSPPVVSVNAPAESSSRNASEQGQSGYPGILIRGIAEEKVNADKTKSDRTDSQKPLEPKSNKATEKTINDSKVQSDDTTDNLPKKVDDETPSASHLRNAKPLECETPPETPTAQTPTEPETSSTSQKTPSISTRLHYSIQDLLKKRTDPATQKRPSDLASIEGVTDSRPMRAMNNPAMNLSQSYQGSSGSRGITISLDKPAFHNRSKNPYKPVNQERMDGDSKFLRQVKAILNKVTPQTYERLLVKLDELELNSAERLEGMISTIFAKAVEERTFCSLYAKLCRHFQHKQVTVPNDDGQMIKHFFRQMLLSRCQKEFESDYRQEIDYDNREIEVNAIADEKARKEAAEQLQEDLMKAKRKKLGNIFFIGELFKTQMLTAPIMYDCVDYLLRDKTDEEGLECLCRLLNTIGRELDEKAGEKPATRTALEKNYRDLAGIQTQAQVSSRIRFMILDLMETRKAQWVARRTEIKPMTIDEIHEQERVKREKQELDQERDRMQRRDQNRGSGNNQQHYNESRGSRGSGIKQQPNRGDDDRGENRFNINSLRQLQSSDKRNQGPATLNFGPQRAWSKGSGIEKKPEDDRPAAGRPGGKSFGPPASLLKPKTGATTETPGYPTQGSSSRELTRDDSTESAQKATNHTDASSSSPARSRDGSSSDPRQVSQNAPRESGTGARLSYADVIVPTSKTLVSSLSTESATTNKADSSAAPFDEEKVAARVQSLIAEFTENYSDASDRPVKEAIEDLSDFASRNIDQQAFIVRELVTNIFEAKPRARKAVGHLLDTALSQEVFFDEGFLAGIQLIFEAVPDFAVDIPLIWQYIGEILGAFIGAPSSNLLLLKSILQMAPAEKSKEFFQQIIQSATEFSSKSRVQRFWQASGYSLDDLLPATSVDAAFRQAYAWLAEAIEPGTASSTNRESLSPRADAQLVKLFKSVTDQGVVAKDDEIVAYIHEHMNDKDKFYIRKIVLSYLEACLINREPQKKIQEDIARQRMTVLNAIIKHEPKAEIQAVYAIQNFVHKLEHPPKMAQLLFDMFYDEECVSEDVFFEWRKRPDPSETEGHSVVEMSTQDFFVWLEQVDTEADDDAPEES